MGQLIFIDQGFNNRIDWYVESAWYDTTSRCWRYQLPNSDFPVLLSIHYDDMDKALKVSIRKYIEEYVKGIVLYTYKDKSYWKSEKGTYSGGYQISNYWHIFYFEDEASALPFKLKFGNYIKEITDEHPRYAE